MPATNQVKVSVGTVEVCNTERRALAWHLAGRPPLVAGQAVPKHDCRKLASRNDCRSYLRHYGEIGLLDLVHKFLTAGGTNATTERAQQRGEI